MLNHLKRRLHHLHGLSLWAAQLMPIAMIVFLSVSVAYGAELEPRSIYIGNDSPSATTSYSVGFSLPGNETLGSIEIQFCSNSPLIGDICNAPNGFSSAGAILSSQTGPGGFSILSQNANDLILSRVPSVVAAQAISLVFSNMVNPSALGSFYARFQTFPTIDASGAATDIGGDALAIAYSVNVSTYVPPYLLFCAAVAIPSFDCSNANGAYINFGYLSPINTSSSDSQMLIATNALNGYSIQVTGSSMTSGNNVITPLISNSSATPGNNQFGLNLVANTNPSVGGNAQGPGSGQPTPPYNLVNDFKFSSGDTLASSTIVSDFKKYTISYIINIASSQPPGYYSTTLTYVAMGNF